MNLFFVSLTRKNLENKRYFPQNSNHFFMQKTDIAQKSRHPRVSAFFMELN